MGEKRPRLSRAKAGGATGPGRALLLEWVLKELKTNPSRGRRNGFHRPISSFMTQDTTGYTSRVFAMCEGAAEQAYPRGRMGLGLAKLALRIARKADLTWFQATLLEKHFCRFYRGEPTLNYAVDWVGMARETDPAAKQRVGEGRVEYVVAGWTRWAHARAETGGWGVPLGAILDERFTNLILTVQLGKVLADAQQERSRENVAKKRLHEFQVRLTERREREAEEYCDFLATVGAGQRIEAEKSRQSAEAKAEKSRQSAEAKAEKSRQSAEAKAEKSRQSAEAKEAQRESTKKAETREEAKWRKKVERVRQFREAREAREREEKLSKTKQPKRYSSARAAS